MGQLRQINRGSPLSSPPKIGLFMDDETGRISVMQLQNLRWHDRSEYFFEREIGNLDQIRDELKSCASQEYRAKLIADAALIVENTDPELTIMPQ